jgi:alpha-methylacyl-CoA racemase
LAATGMLQALGRAGETPAPPLNLIADFGGGSMFALVGLLSALVERERSGRGQVVDVSMVEGTLSLSAMIWSWRAAGRWSEDRGTNLLDGGAPFYDTYRCEDGRFMAIGSLEPRFYALALAGLGIDASTLPAQYDPQGWPLIRSALAAAFASHPQQHWAERFAGSDACVSPVLTFDEAQQHEHLRQRGAFVSVDGVEQPAASPRFSRSVPAAPTAETFGDLAHAKRRWADAAVDASHESWSR